MRWSSQITPPCASGTIALALSALTLVLSPASPVRAQGMNASADAEFLTKVVPSIAASVKIIDYEVKNTSDATVREFAQRVLKQHTESVKTATEHARRLKIAVDTSGDKDSKEMLDKLSALKGSERDAAFLEWLSHIHHDTTLFDNEVKNGSDAALKSYAKGSITAGNGHLDEAQELLAKLKK
jgi:putative membrane protein